MNSTEAPDVDQKKELKKGKKEMAFERVRLAFERLQLAWLRTAITFVALGFTAYKFYFGRIEEGRTPLVAYFNGRGIGFFLIFVGLLGLAQATIQHRKNCARLKKLYPIMPYSISLTQSYFILLFTLTLLLVVVFEL